MNPIVMIMKTISYILQLFSNELVMSKEEEIAKSIILQDYTSNRF